MGKSTILTDSVARKHLEDVSRALQLPRVLTFHDFRVVGPLGHSIMGPPYKIFSSKVLGPPSASGDIFVPLL